MDPKHKLWNERHKRLRQLLKQPENHAAAIELFLQQHAMGHRADMSNKSLHPFADEVWQSADEAALRCLPPKFEHSIVWLIWHIARIEDMTMSILMAGKPQILFLGDWLRKPKITERHSGNVVMNDTDVIAFSKAIDIEALKAYRLAVGRATHEAVSTLQPDEVQKKSVSPVCRNYWSTAPSNPKRRALSNIGAT